MGNGTHGQRDTVVNTAHRDGATWGMGHMGDGTHGQHLWSCVTSLILHGSLQKFYWT